MNRDKLFRLKDFITPVTYYVSLVASPKCVQSFSVRTLAKQKYKTPRARGFTSANLRFAIGRGNATKPPCDAKRYKKARQVKITENWSKTWSIAAFNTIVPNIFWYSTYKTNYTIVRPLMNFSRRTVTINCILRRLPVYPDLSNSKMRYSRNRIRKQIIPAIKFLLNPKIEKALFQFSEFYNRDNVLNRGSNL